jgi:hypothetical protein
MFIQSKNPWHPLGRSARAPGQERPQIDTGSQAASDEPDEQLDAETDEPLNEEPAAMSDADFASSLRGSVAGVRSGLVPSITSAMRPSPQDRPHSKRWRPRDKRGNRIY